MPASVLVAYGTTNGSTAQIAEAVAEVLRKGGLIPDLLPARSVVDVTPYDAVVLGSGLYAGRWHRDARRFVSRHGRQLAERPLWLFSSGPLDSSASERDIPPVRGVRRTMVRLGARSHVTFGGCLEEEPRDASPSRSCATGRAEISATSARSSTGRRGSPPNWRRHSRRSEQVSNG